MVLLYMVCHGSHQYIPFMLAYIAAPWILWVICSFIMFVGVFKCKDRLPDLHGFVESPPMSCPGRNWTLAQHSLQLEKFQVSHDGSMVLLYMVTWIPSIWPPMLPYMAVCQNLVPLVNIKIAGKWMFIPLKMVLIGIDS